MSSRLFAMRAPTRERLSIRLTPVDSTAPDASVLSGTTFATQNVLTWTLPEVGLSFDLYRDGELLAILEDVHTYTDVTTTTVSHSYYVISRDNAGNVSSNSNTVTLQYVPPDTTPPTSSVLSGQNVNATSNYLSWTAPNDAVNFEVYRSGTKIATQTTLTFADSIDASISYTYTVRSYDAAGNGSTSNAVTLQYIAPPPPVDTTPPVPAQLSGNNVNATTNQLTWSAVTDAATYRIYRDGALIATQAMVNFTDTVNASVSHVYKVTSSDTAGNWSADSNVVTLQYIAPPPPGDTTPPAAAVMTGDRKGSKTNVLNWVAVPGAVQYRVYKDNVLIATQAWTGLVEGVDKHDSNTYHITSRDEAGNWSAPSNFITLDRDSPGNSENAPGHNKDPLTGEPTGGMGSWPLHEITLGRPSSDPNDAVRKMSRK